MGINSRWCAPFYILDVLTTRCIRAGVGTALAMYICNNKRKVLMTIQVTIKSVYGNKTIYPVCEKAKLFAAIAGTSTLLVRDLDKIKALGYTVELINAYSL